MSENLIVNYYQEKSSAFVDNYYWIIPIGMANVYFLLFENYLKGLYKHIVAVFAYEILLRLFVMVLLIMLWKKIIDFTYKERDCNLPYIPAYKDYTIEKEENFIRRNDIIVHSEKITHNLNEAVSPLLNEVKSFSVGEHICQVIFE